MVRLDLLSFPQHAGQYLRDSIVSFTGNLESVARDIWYPNHLGVQ